MWEPANLLFKISEQLFFPDQLSKKVPLIFLENF